METFAQSLARSLDGVESVVALATHHHPLWSVRYATEWEQRKGIDIVATREDGSEVTIEVKSDFVWSRTGNVFIETTSVESDGKAGWVYTCTAQLLAIVDPVKRRAYVRPMARVRSAFLSSWALRRRVAVMTDGRWITTGVPVPAKEFEFLTTAYEWRLPSSPSVKGGRVS